jgi:general secretion pathway protein F
LAVNVFAMRFDLKVYRDGQGVHILTLDAMNKDAACRQAESQHYTVLSAQPSRKLLALSLWLTKDRFSAEMFCRQLLTLLDAGLGLVEAIDLLYSKSKLGEAGSTLGELNRRLSEGIAFSKALDNMSDSFPPIFVATVRASERTGDLPEALRRYLDYQHKVNAMRDKVIAASVYPLLLIAIGGLVLVFLLAYVVPRFSKVYEDVGQDKLPALSRLLMLWGQIASDHLSLIIGAMVALASGSVYLFTRPSVRAALEQRLWKIAAIGEYLRVYQLARFTRTVAMLLKGGIPLLTALQMTDDLLRQPALRVGLVRARRAVSEGKNLSDSFAEHGLATDIGVRLLVVGERSGELGATMERLAVFYDEEIARTVEWFSRLFEPMLMLVIGLLIGGIVILMYLPIFELASTVQ